jgi:hypothetical protein
MRSERLSDEALSDLAEMLADVCRKNGNVGIGRGAVCPLAALLDVAAVIVHAEQFATTADTQSCYVDNGVSACEVPR